MPDSVVYGLTSYNLGITDVINNAIACQTATSAYGSSPTVGQDPSEYDPYPQCFFHLPVLYVGPFSSVDSASDHSPCKIRNENQDNDDSEGVGYYLPDNLATSFTMSWCFPDSTATCTTKACELGR